jgi:hypothetical protein
LWYADAGCKAKKEIVDEIHFSISQQEKTACVDVLFSLVLQLWEHCG